MFRNVTEYGTAFFRLEAEYHVRVQTPGPDVVLVVRL